MTKLYLVEDGGRKCAAAFWGNKLAFSALDSSNDKTAFLYNPGNYDGMIVTVLDEKRHYKEIKIMPNFADKLLKLCKTFSQF